MYSVIISKIVLILASVISFFIYFNRHPDIDIIPTEVSDEHILAPSYGTIKKIIHNQDNIHIVIFLSPKDVHVQYYPIRGTVTYQHHDMTGQFELAYELGKSSKNEKMITHIKPKIDIPEIKIYQIAGYFVRRIETELKYVGEKVEPSQKLGMIKFGSRVDIIIPNANANTNKHSIQLNVHEGMEIKGPHTVLGKVILN